MCLLGKDVNAVPKYRPAQPPSKFIFGLGTATTADVTVRWPDDVLRPAALGPNPESCIMNELTPMAFDAV